MFLGLSPKGKAPSPEEKLGCMFRKLFSVRTVLQAFPESHFFYFWYLNPANLSWPLSFLLLLPDALHEPVDAEVSVLQPGRVLFWSIPDTWTVAGPQIRRCG